MQGVIFHRLAERELTEAAQYYESRSPGLGRRFLHRIERCVESIVESPEAGRVVRGSVRRRIVRSFPYAVLYSLRPGAVRILAVMHLRRRPMYGVGRE